MTSVRNGALVNSSRVRVKSFIHLEQKKGRKWFTYGHSKPSNTTQPKQSPKKESIPFRWNPLYQRLRAKVCQKFGTRNKLYGPAIGMNRNAVREKGLTFKYFTLTNTFCYEGGRR